jgi:hypothetical protein
MPEIRAPMKPQPHADLRFVLGAMLALAVLVAFVVSLHLLRP